MGIHKKMIIVSITLLAVIALFIFSTAHPSIDFNTQVKPIFNSKCITCHGGVKKKSGFSVLFRSEAMGIAESGKRAIIPGDPDNSEMIRRITLKDPEDRMPYKHPPLSEAEISTLRQWVKQGAPWGDHWAYVPVKETEVPKPKGYLWGLIPASSSSWGKNDIDFFIQNKLEKENFKPSPEADKATLLRRVGLDLTGLPAPVPFGKKFLENNSDKAYEDLVDSLLASPRFGERWTSMWLDLARYADTKGYEADMGRTIWEYRDWLIKAFNEDKPYNVFLTEQLAGDLLPEPTDAQLIATAFQRNSMTNDEGGTDNEEFRTAAVLDRTNTTWEALMGTTFGCVQCHSHPYDPFSHDEYYKFMAFYNNTRDEDTQSDYPLLREYSSEDELKLKNLKGWLSENAKPEETKEITNFLKTWQPAINSIICDKFVNASLVSSWFAGFHNNGSCRLKHVSLDNKQELVFRYKSYVPGGTWSIHLDKPDGPVIKSIHLDSTKGEWRIVKTDIVSPQGVHDLFFEYQTSYAKSPDETCVLFDWFYFTNPFPGSGKPGYDSANKKYWELINAKVSTTPVMIENPSDMVRVTNVFERGNWLVKGNVVNPDVPRSLNPFPVNAPRNRLGLAMWLTSKQNPLTARTMVNRLWEQLFGAGLVETLEDMGTQGAAPTHRELLDFLSYRFMNDFHWSIKRLLKEIVMSATYRQDSKASNELLEKDLYNKLYARGARVRLSAEQVRDQALYISGLLSSTMYGPPVMPWQPQGIWLSPYNDRAWLKSNGEDQYRRAVYTFWKRTAPYPSMMSFDAVSREVCAARRIRTNTPLQALVAMNDSVYLEAGRHFAYTMQKMATNKLDVLELIRKGYQLAMDKPIPAPKLTILKRLYDTAYHTYKNDPSKTCDLIGIADEHNNPETAALIIVANAMLNLDEFITKN
ncbi:MAG: DUF1553 domain-containing protein [Chitinophagaceae bacterium]